VGKGKVGFATATGIGIAAEGKVEVGVGADIDAGVRMLVGALLALGIKKFVVGLESSGRPSLIHVRQTTTSPRGRFALACGSGLPQRAQGGLGFACDLRFFAGGGGALVDEDAPGCVEVDATGGRGGAWR